MKPLYFYLILFITTNTQAQNNLFGKVLTHDNEPLEFATVFIYPIQDSTDISGSITDKNGVFEFINLSPMTYQLSIQMLGYKDWTKEIILDKEIDLADIILHEEAELLDAVQIVAEQSSIESHLGKKVLRIGKDLSTTGSSALEALDIIPSVTTTPKGQIQIRGNSNVIIYINGKETQRDPATLKFIAAESLEKIEIITNPSAQHDAEGVGGIINIVYIKDKSTSVKLELLSNLSVLTNPLYLSPNGGLNFSWTKKKISLFANLSHDYGKYEDYVNSNRISFTDNLHRYENLTNQKGIGNISNALIGFTVEPDSTSSFGLEANLSRWDVLDKITQVNNFEYRSAENESISLQSERGEIENELWVNLSYEKTFTNKSNLKVSLTAGGEDESNFSQSEDIDLTDLPVNLNQFLLSSDELENQRYYQGNVDYELPLNKWGKLQAGLKLDFINYHICQKLELQSEVIELPDNDFDMDMQKAGAYLIQKKKFKNFEYAIGLRLENFSSNAFQHANLSSFTQDYIRLFPSLQLNYKIDQINHTIGMNYTRRINRPGFFDLNPYVSFQDPLNLETGNPSLEPEIADLIEINLQQELKRINIDVTLYHRSTSNSIQDIVQVIDNNRTLSTSKNIGNQISHGIESQIEFKLNKFFKTSGTLVISQIRYEDTENDIFFNNRSSWSLRFWQELKFNDNWKIELSEIYRAPRYQIQQKTHENYYMNLGINKKFNNKRGSLSLSVRDLFNTRQYIRSLHTSSFEVEKSYKWQTRQITLGLKYSIIDIKY